MRRFRGRSTTTSAAPASTNVSWRLGALTRVITTLPNDDLGSYAPNSTFAWLDENDADPPETQRQILSSDGLRMAVLREYLVAIFPGFKVQLSKVSGIFGDCAVLALLKKDDG
jgi:hypothetical protein